MAQVRTIARLVEEVEIGDLIKVGGRVYLVDDIVYTVGNGVHNLITTLVNTDTKTTHAMYGNSLVEVVIGHDNG